jgi:hypothetical protein
MPFQPNEIWQRLSPELQRQISDELSTILQEVLYEQIRTGESPAPRAQGTHLHPTIDPASSALQSGELTPAVCAATARCGSGVEAGGY